MANVCVVGGGYVGLVTSGCLAALGHKVHCVEIEPGRLRSLQSGELPVYEPELDHLVTRCRRAGTLTFTDKYEEALHNAKSAVIAVNTPPGRKGQADTRFVFRAVECVLGWAPSDLTLVIKSTVPVGTADAIAESLLERPTIHVVSNPEFLRQGSAVQDFLDPDRIVIGASCRSAALRVAGLYAGIHAPIVLCSRRSAELAKYAANALLATRISFVNEIASICEAVDADIDEVVRAVGSDKRIGSSFLASGLGWGGSCFPKDVMALIHTARNHGQSPLILQSVLDVNMGQRKQAVQKLRATLAGCKQPILGVLGLAFKPNTDDVRGSPALSIIQALLSEGTIRVRAHDPKAMDKAKELLPGIEYYSDSYSMAAGSDALLLATEWPEYLGLDWSLVRSLMRRAVVVDGRNALDGHSLRRLGFTYLSFGGHSNGNGLLGNEPGSRRHLQASEDLLATATS